MLLRRAEKGQFFKRDAQRFSEKLTLAFYSLLFHRLFHRFLRAPALSALVLLLWLIPGTFPNALAAPTPAGTVISNTASASFVDSTTGLSVTLRSNTVNTIVAVAEAVSLSASQSVLAPTGGAFTISHTLTNTGNASTFYNISTVIASGSNFQPVNLQVVQDINGNGRVDPGEPAIANGAGVTVAAGASISLLITAQSPASATDGQAAQIVLSATSSGQGATASNTDNVGLTSGAAIQVALTASSSSPIPGSTLGLTASVSNSGSSAAAAGTVIVDGVPTPLVLLRLQIPANTTFLAAQPTPTAGAQILYHLPGAAANRYVTVLPAGVAPDSVAWALPTLPSAGRLQGQITVTVNANANGSLSDTAYFDWSQQGAPLSTASNALNLALPARAATIGFFTSSAYAVPALQTRSGNPLFVQTDAAACNVDATRIDTVSISLTSQLTGDTEVFSAVETGSNTGIFRILPNVPTANGMVHIVASGDGILEILRNDMVTATISSCGAISASATTTLLIDPSGIVFDSQSNAPVAGATVTLIDVTGGGNGGSAGGPAVVFESDGVTAASNVVVTGPDGSYAFPLAAPSTYKLVVATPPGYAFPSQLARTAQPAGRVIDAQASYGATFVLGGSVRQPLRFDLPLDSGGAGGLFIQKTANKATAELGDFIDYTVRLNNLGKTALPAVTVSDTLPIGFAYVRGSARLNSAALPDPTGGGSSLLFALGSVAASAQPTLTYRVRVGAGSQSGSGINSAQASSATSRSNLATVRVQIVGGVFSDKAYLIGKVYAQCKADSPADSTEAGSIGIPGVRVYLEDGTYAVTDEAGKYSLYGLTPRTHVAKVDSTTLPSGTALTVLSNRNAGDAASQFVDLTNGELRKANFAVTGCSDDLAQQIKARRAAITNPSEIAQAAATLLSTTNAANNLDARTLPASGSVGLPGALQNNAATTTRTMAGVAAPLAFATRLGAVADPGGPYAPTAQGRPQPIVTPLPALAGVGTPLPADASDSLEPLEKVLPQLTPEVSFIGLLNGQVMRSEQARIRVKGPLGAQLELNVNDQTIAAAQVGKKSTLDSTATVAWEYIGINLHPGKNLLALRALDSFGVVRGSARVEVIVPGPLASIRITVPTLPVADGASAVSVKISLRDADGLLVSTRTPVTLQASLGQWQVPAQEVRPEGVQVFIEGGEGQLWLLPPAQPGTAELSATSGTLRHTEKIEFVPNLRPMIAAGLIEGSINLRKLNPQALQPTQSVDVFERQIQSAARSFNQGKGEAAARTALFLKGKVLGSSLLTLSYDSDKPSDTTLFRDIQPDQFYPVYGDSSARGFDAQSTGKLYVMLQNGTSYALLGDFATISDNPARQLTQYARALNGAKGRLQQGGLTLEAFASRTASTQIVQEFRADGTSGPFRLNLNGVANSQQVDIITRDRNQPSVTLKDTPLTQFIDYQIEPYSGLLILKSPVSSVDNDLNPILIRVSYAIDSGGPKHSVMGVDARYQVTPNVTVGATAVRDTDPLNSQTLTGVNLLAKLGEKTIATAEIARSNTTLQGSGAAQRVEIRHDDAQLQARVWGVHTDAEFYNPSSTQSAGQSEYGAKLGYTIDATNRIVVEDLKTNNSVTGAAQSALELRLEHTLAGNVKIEAGLRRSRSNNVAVLSALPLPGSAAPVIPNPAAVAALPESATVTTARLKVTVPVPGLPAADLFALAETAVDGSGGRETGIGGNYVVNASTRLYFRHDFINSLNGPNAFNPALSQYTTVAGINTALSDSTQLVNEYRMGDSINGRTSEAAVGVRQSWRLSNDVGISASVQRIKPISGVTLDDASALALGADYTGAADWKGSVQGQWQSSNSTRSWLFNAAVVNKLNDEWTLLNRALYNTQTSLAPSTGARQLVSAQSGLAYRPVETDRWNALGRIQYKRDADSTAGPGLERNEAAWIVSSHVNLQPQRNWSVSGRYAAKWARDQANALSSQSMTQLAGARLTWDLNSSWDLGLQSYRIWGDGAAETALGLEVGYVVWKNFWLSLGYNVKGFRAPDLAGDATTQSGVFLRTRFKFDESILRGTGD